MDRKSPFYTLNNVSEWDITMQSQITSDVEEYHQKTHYNKDYREQHLSSPERG